MEKTQFEFATQNLTYAEKRRLLEELQDQCSAELREIRDAARKEKLDAIAKLEKELHEFLDGINFTRQSWMDTEKLALVSMKNFETNLLRSKYHKALGMIEQGFKEIKRIKIAHIDILYASKKPNSTYFYTTESRMRKEKAKREKEKENLRLENLRLEKEKAKWRKKAK